ATSFYDRNSSKIYIESDFTNNATTAKSFVRRGGIITQGTHYSQMGENDYASGALQLIGDALDNVTNTNIISTQKTLSLGDSNKLVIFLFTDAIRDDYGSSLVAPFGQPFTAYNQFKSGRGATFVA